MFECIVMFKLKTQPSLTGSTFTGATATGVTQATQDEINVYQEKAMEEITAALKQVPGRFLSHVTDMISGPSLLLSDHKGSVYTFLTALVRSPHTNASWPASALREGQRMELRCVHCATPGPN